MRNVKHPDSLLKIGDESTFELGMVWNDHVSYIMPFLLMMAINQSVFHGISCHVRVWSKNAEISKYFPTEVGYAALNNPVFYKDGPPLHHQVDTMLAERLFDQLVFNIYIYTYIYFYLYIYIYTHITPKNHWTLPKKRGVWMSMTQGSTLGSPVPTSDLRSHGFFQAEGFLNSRCDCSTSQGHVASCLGTPGSHRYAPWRCQGYRTGSGSALVCKNG